MGQQATSSEGFASLFPGLRNPLIPRRAAPTRALTPAPRVSATRLQPLCNPLPNRRIRYTMRSLSFIHRRNNRLIDFIFQDTTDDDPLETLRPEAKQEAFWSTLVKWVYKK